MVEQLVCRELDLVTCCQTLKVSRSGYYRWLNRCPSQRKIDNERLLRQIAKIHQESRETYGAPRVFEKLKSEGENCGKKKVARLMKKQGLRGVAAKKYRVKTTDSDHDLPIADRIFKTEAAAEQVTRPNQFWASDITYIQTDEGWLFLAIFLDLFTRKVVGLSMEDNMRTELILNALQMALGRQHIFPEHELVGHSDRGSQYAAEAYRNCLESKGITASMSRRANCYDNAFAESFFHTLKVELVHRRNFKTRQEAMAAIFEYIEVWYNRQRIHSSLGYKTPMEYEQTALAA
jgi:putative transposase